MNVLYLMLAVFLGYILMYNLYGRFLGSKIFKLSAKRVAPSVKFRDDVDYVPTNKHVIFGHHYTSIAGTGPIVGPAIAIIWGWVPALIWIFFGSVFMGAVHDFGALVVSMRNEGKSLTEVAEKYITKRAKFFLFSIIFLALLIVIAIFGLVIAVIFNMFPAAIFPVWFEVPIAIALGMLVYRKGWKAFWPSVVALLAMYLTVVLGYYWQFTMPSVLGIPPTGIWTIILLIYAFIASVLPVTTLLQPRDYINSHQLIVAMGLLVLGVLVAAFTTDLTFVAPAIQKNPTGAPSMWPFIFITIACGAISGFHSLVSSGTTSKQVAKEKDSLFVGYGSMLMEGGLAVLVIIAVGAGIGLGYEGLHGVEAWNAHYASWTAAKGLGSKVTAFVMGSANLIQTLGIPQFVAVTIMGVFVASFASTTLDSATRIQRYVITEAFSGFDIEILKNRYFTTFLVVLSAGALAFASGADGKGALTLWPLFGAINQVLAALALTIITVYLKSKGGFKWLFSGIPAIIMLFLALSAVVYNEINFLNQDKFLLATINGIVFFIAIGIGVEVIKKLREIKSQRTELELIDDELELEGV